MKLFLAGTSFQPNYGGPARSVSQLADTMCRAGLEVAIWAPDGSAVSNPFLSSPTKVRRLSGDLESAIKQIGVPDIVHDSGIWLRHNHQIAGLARRLGAVRIVSTRGMLETWAFKHKRLKKWIAWKIYQKRDLKSADAIHATSEMEAKSVGAFKLRNPILVVPNGVEIPVDVASMYPANSTKEKGHVSTALFVGRLYPVKGLPMLIDAWNKVRPRGWRLQIVGPDEAGHAKSLQKQIDLHGLGQVIELVGPIEGAEKWDVMYASDLFVCPSYTENFGMAIAEAMACGLPVLTTTGTPWKSIAENRCGWYVSPTVDAIADALRAATQLNFEDRIKMGEIGKRMVNEKFGWDNAGRQMLSHYELLLTRNASKKHRPDGLDPSDVKARG